MPATYHTQFGSIDDYEKGRVEIIGDDAKHYAFSNCFEVAANARPYEKIVTAINQIYVLETLRAEGESPWYTCAHDEFALCMDGQVDIHLIKLDQSQQVSDQEKNGAVLVASGLDGDPPDYVPLTTTVVLTKPETCAKSRVICEGVGQAMKDASQILHAQPAEAKAILAKRLPNMDPKLIDVVVEKITKATPTPLAVTAKALENAERLNIESGLLKPEEKLASYDGLFTDAYVK